MAFSVAGRIAPKSCLLLSSQKALHVLLDEPDGGSIRFTWAVQGRGMPQLEETSHHVHFMAVIGLVLGDGNSHSRRATFFGFRLFICSYLNQITTPSINVLSFGKVKVWMEACRQDSAFSLLPLFYRVSLPHGILQFYTVFLEGN